MIVEYVYKKDSRREKQNVVITENNKPLIIERTVPGSGRVISLISELPQVPSVCTIHPITFSSLHDVYIDGSIFEFTNPIWVITAGQNVSATDLSFYDENYSEILLPFKVQIKRNNKNKKLWYFNKINEKFIVVDVSPTVGVYLVVNSSEFNGKLIRKKDCQIVA